MPRILFTETRVVRDEHRGTANETKYEAGKVYDLPEASCARWKARGVAVDAPPEPPVPFVEPAVSFSPTGATIRLRADAPISEIAAYDSGEVEAGNGDDTAAAEPVEIRHFNKKGRRR